MCSEEKCNVDSYFHRAAKYVQCPYKGMVTCILDTMCVPGVLFLSDRLERG